MPQNLDRIDTQGKRTKHGKPLGAVSDDQPDAREGQAGRPGVAERFVYQLDEVITAGGRRPWFRCPVYLNGQYCGRRVAVLYAAGELFACRHCYGLGYASQQESPQSRFIRRSRKIRMRLDGSPDLLQPLPKRPRGMHQRTYMRLQARDPFVAARRGMVEVAELIRRGLLKEDERNDYLAARDAVHGHLDRT